MKTLTLIFALAFTLSLSAQEKIVQAFNSISGLVQIDPNIADNTIACEGLQTSGDGGGGMMRYYPTSSASTNAATVFKPTNFNGRWIMVFGGPGTTTGLVGALIMTGTPAVGDIATASTTSGTNGVWATPIWTAPNAQLYQLAGPTLFQVFTNGNILIGSASSNYFGEYRGLFYNRFVDSALGEGGSFEFAFGAINSTNSPANSTVDIYGNTANVNLSLTTQDPILGSSGLRVNANAAAASSVLSLVYGNLTGVYLDPLGTGSSPYHNYFVCSATNDYFMAWLNSASEPMMRLSMYGVLETPSGYISLATDTPVAISSTGWTNSFVKAAEVWFVGTNVTYTVADNAGTLIRTNITSTGLDTHQILLQTGGKMVVTSGTVVGSATPF